MELPFNFDNQFEAAIKVKLVELATTSWEFWFGLTARFLEENKHSI